MKASVHRVPIVFPAVVACVWLIGCERQGVTTDPQVQPAPVDLARINPVETAAWPHRRVIEADLDGDGRRERVVLAADVQLSATGKPLWEDGHRWVVSVGDAPPPTLLYGAFVPNGHVDAAILSADAAGRRHVLVRERTPTTMRTFVISYDEAGIAQLMSQSTYNIEAWVPALVGIDTP
jgi:hypothetical protein